MKEFILLFRHVPNSNFVPTPEQITAEVAKWNAWIGDLVEKGSFIKTEELEMTSKLISPGKVVTDGPYAEVKEIVGGFALIKANSYEEAVELSYGCPIYDHGGTLEVRGFVDHSQYE